MLTVIILGASGGPFESGTQSFLVKESRNSYISFDCGSGLSSISKLFMKDGNQEMDLYGNSYRYLQGSGLMEDLTDSDVDVSFEEPEEIEGDNLVTKTSNFFSRIRYHFISHSHLDHINSMVLNSPMAFDPYFSCNLQKGRQRHKRSKMNNNLSETRKVYYGLASTIQPIQTHIFNCHIWPNVLYGNEDIIKLETIKPRTKISGFSSVSKKDKADAMYVMAFPVVHGKRVEDPKQQVMSTGFYTCNPRANESVMIFGDCQSEPVYLGKVWEFLSGEIMNEGIALKGLFIECSTADMLNLGSEGTLDTDSDLLYGHFIPFLLCKELFKFKLCIEAKHKNKQPIAPINIFITHVKQVIGTQDPRVLILQQLQKHATYLQIDQIFKFSIAINSHTYKL